MKCGLTECGETDSGLKDTAKGNAAYRNAAKRNGIMLVSKQFLQVSQISKESEMSVENMVSFDME